jgi:hypothetical protein
MLSITYYGGCIWQLCFVGSKEKERKGGEHGQREEDEALRAYHGVVCLEIGRPKGQGWDIRGSDHCNQEHRDCKVVYDA